jgi:Protein of unknown function (DUF3303)
MLPLLTAFCQEGSHAPCAAPIERRRGRYETTARHACTGASCDTVSMRAPLWGMKHPGTKDETKRELGMLFMVIERFRNRDPNPIYRRLRDQGRQMPDGLKYVDSWIEPTFERCFQLMECDDARLLQQWIVNWHDLMEFEIVLVVPSKDTREIVAARLDEATVKDDP